MIYKKAFILITLFTLNAENSYCQNLFEYAQANAIKIQDIDSLGDEMYKLLSPKKIIMVGEIHGTNEPIMFVQSLIKLFTDKGDSVQLGFEIPENQMAVFMKNPEITNLIKTEFFSYPSGDGRASSAWYHCIAYASNNPKVKVFFFDRSSNDYRNADSVMYLNIRNRIKLYPNWKLITISGSMHNQIMAEKNQTSFGMLLYLDEKLIDRKNICSIDHQFAYGETIWNEFERAESDYTKLKLKTFFLHLPPKYSNNYNAVLYTEKLTKSDSAINR